MTSARITIERPEFIDDDGVKHKAETIVLQDISDYIVSVRQRQPIGDADGMAGYSLETTSLSHITTNVRAMAMELHQSEIELQDKLRAVRNGPSA